MPDRIHIENLETALLERMVPTVTVWNRLEGRPRTRDFSRALRAEVRDGLWMLTRQIQTGELQADDAASPVLAKVAVASTAIGRFAASTSGASAPLDPNVPLEATVEAQSVESLFGINAANASGAIDLRLMLGRRFLRLIPTSYRAAFIQQYPFTAPSESAVDAERTAQLEVWSMLRALSGRAMDGYLLYRRLKSSASATPWGAVAVADSDKKTIRDAAAAMVALLDGLVVAPSAVPTAWDTERLEHSFAVEATVADGQKRFVADRFGGGRLDWTAFSVDPRRGRANAALGEPFATIPTRVSYAGMASNRWWSFEDSRVNFGHLTGDTTDLARLAFVEFGVAFANDWFSIPLPLDVSSLSSIGGLVVTDVFGERTWIEGAGRGLDDDPTRWAVFSLDVAGPTPEPADLSLVVPPTVAHSLEGDLLEEVTFVRDEVANMVFGVETTVLSPLGRGRRGGEVAADYVARLQQVHGVARVVRAPALGGGATDRYSLMDTIPEHWIPFVAVHRPGDVRETQLQRGALPRLVDGLAPDPVRPRTSLLRVGLDQVTVSAYFVHDEEVPRAGTVVSRRFERVRWFGGRSVLWLATRRSTGRGEASSGLAFDSLHSEPR